MAEVFVRVAGAEGPVAEVWLDRPAKRNAVTLDMLDQLVDAGRALAASPGLRAVVLAGEGGDFCAGLDTAVFMDMASQIEAVKAEMLSPPAGEIANRFQLPTTIWQALPVPVIAAVDGVCFGAGAQIALGADFRVMHPECRFSIMESKWGLVPDMGISQSLPRLLPADRAKELIMTARVLRGAEAYRMGLATRLSDDPVDEARQFAAALAARSPEAMRSAKRLVDGLYSGDAVAALTLEAELQAALMGTPNQIEAVMANIQKRAPTYR